MSSFVNRNGGIILKLGAKWKCGPLGSRTVKSVKAAALVRQTRCGEAGSHVHRAHRAWLDPKWMETTCLQSRDQGGRELLLPQIYALFIPKNISVSSWPAGHCDGSGRQYFTLRIFFLSTTSLSISPSLFLMLFYLNETRGTAHV